MVVVMMMMMMIMMMMVMTHRRISADVTGSPQTYSKAAITTVMCMQTEMAVQQDSWPPCLYWQLLVFSWLSATV